MEVINPKTNRKIKVGSATYNKLVRDGLLSEYSGQWSAMPVDVLLLILKQLDKRDIINLCNTDKELQKRCASGAVRTYIENLPDYVLDVDIDKDSMIAEGHFIGNRRRVKLIWKKTGNKYQTFYLPFGKNPNPYRNTLQLYNGFFTSNKGEQLSFKNFNQFKAIYSIYGKGTAKFLFRLPVNQKLNTFYCISGKCFGKEELNSFDLNKKPFGKELPEYTKPELYIFKNYDNRLVSWFSYDFEEGYFTLAG